MQVVSKYYLHSANLCASVTRYKDVPCKHVSFIQGVFCQEIVVIKFRLKDGEGLKNSIYSLCLFYSGSILGSPTPEQGATGKKWPPTYHTLLPETPGLL